MPFIILIVIGLVTGWLVASFTEGRGLGLAWNVVVGIIGSLLGGILFGMVGERLGWTRACVFGLNACRSRRSSGFGSSR